MYKGFEWYDDIHMILKNLNAISQSKQTLR